MQNIPVFFCERVGEGICTENYWCKCGHNTRIVMGRFKEADRPEFPSRKQIGCINCGEMVEICSQGFKDIYRRVDNGQEIDSRDGLPPGACYAQRPEYGYRTGPDGRTIMVVCPDGHHWCVDSRASNCTMKDDNEHRCWVRHGSPETGTLHVDKNGRTCQAGGGSIDTGKWHGFLHDGQLKPA